MGVLYKSVKKQATWLHWGLWAYPVMLLVATLLGAIANIQETSWAGQILGLPHMDKVAHAGYIGLLSILLARRWRVGMVVLVGVGVSVGIEVLQATLTDYRQPNPMDAWAGVVGCWLGWGCYQIKFIKNIFETRIGATQHERRKKS